MIRRSWVAGQPVESSALDFWGFVPINTIADLLTTTPNNSLTTSRLQRSRVSFALCLQVDPLGFGKVQPKLVGYIFNGFAPRRCIPERIHRRGVSRKFVGCPIALLVCEIGLS